ncbi:MAG: S8 family serine peptidase [bacterium]
MQRSNLIVIARLVVIVLGLANAEVSLASQQEGDALELIRSGCEKHQNGEENVAADFAGVSPEFEHIEVRGQIVGQRYLYKMSANDSIRIDVIESSGPPRFILELRVAKEPSLFIGLDDSCTVREVRRIIYEDGQAMQLELLNESLKVIHTEPLNPAPLDSEKGSDQSMLAVAMVDSGVNYLLPEINPRMARNTEGELLGYDFWDLDSRPFDAHPAGSPFFIQRHGTRTASLLLREDHDVRLVSYRYPRSEMARMSDLIEHADDLGVRIIGLPLGSNRSEDWTAFDDTVKGHPHILFIASAGNNGRDIEIEPVYPAALDLENMIVVTSAGDYPRPAERTNWGMQSVDYLLPAERRTVLEFSGEEGVASGSSYAVSRMVAMASRLLGKDSDMDTQMLIAAIDTYSIKPDHSKWVRHGYIPDPRNTGAAPEFTLLSNEKKSINSADRNLSLNVLQLDARWEIEETKAAIEEVNTILAQCGIAITKLKFFGTEIPDYLQDLETGTAHTVLERFRELHPDENDIVLLLARDSRMQIEFEAQAFGQANSATRPWLENTLWIMHGARDVPIVLAHEMMHILSNSGEHAPSPKNLMSADTDAQGTALTPAQCALAQGYF